MAETKLPLQRCNVPVIHITLSMLNVNLLLVIYNDIKRNFLNSEFWRHLFSIIEKGQDARHPSWLYVVSAVNHLMLMVNSSINFVIYCAVGSRFRKALVTKLSFFGSRRSGGSREQNSGERAVRGRPLEAIGNQVEPNGQYGGPHNALDDHRSLAEISSNQNNQPSKVVIKLKRMDAVVEDGRNGLDADVSNSSSPKGTIATITPASSENLRISHEKPIQTLEAFYNCTKKQVYLRTSSTQMSDL